MHNLTSGFLMAPRERSSSSSVHACQPPTSKHCSPILIPQSSSLVLSCTNALTVTLCHVGPVEVLQDCKIEDLEEEMPSDQLLLKIAGAPVLRMMM
ncbi:hypothetical protein AAY473_023392, partial [Plecturocebus cupreus]